MVIDLVSTYSMTDADYDKIIQLVAEIKPIETVVKCGQILLGMSEIKNFLQLWPRTTTPHTSM